jgi:hypothetical protein
MLREEGWLAAAVGDRSGAVRDYRHYRHYLALRTLAEPTGAAETARVCAELVRFQRKLRGVALIPPLHFHPACDGKQVDQRGLHAFHSLTTWRSTGGPRVKGAE